MRVQTSLCPKQGFKKENCFTLKRNAQHNECFQNFFHLVDTCSQKELIIDKRLPGFCSLCVFRVFVYQDWLRQLDFPWFQRLKRKGRKLTSQIEKSTLSYRLFVSCSRFEIPNSQSMCKWGVKFAGRWTVYLFQSLLSTAPLNSADRYILVQDSCKLPFQRTKKMRTRKQTILATII